MSKRTNPRLTLILILWGAWRRGDVKGMRCLGYPNLTPDARLYTSPGRGSLPSGSPDYWSDAELIEVNNRIGMIAPRSQNALWCRYVADFPDIKSAVAMGTDVLGYRSLLVRSVELAADAIGIKPYTWSQRTGAKKKLDAVRLLAFNPCSVT